MWCFLLRLMTNSSMKLFWRILTTSMMKVMIQTNIFTEVIDGLSGGTNENKSPSNQDSWSSVPRHRFLALLLPSCASLPGQTGAVPLTTLQSWECQGDKERMKFKWEMQGWTHVRQIRRRGCEQPGSFSIHASSYTSEYLMNQYAAGIQSIDTCTVATRVDVPQSQQ